MEADPVSPDAVHWGLDPQVTFLNHGSFGACPRPVLAVQRALQDRLEHQPVRFFRDLPGLLDAARTHLGAFIDAPPEDLVFVTNATTGVNTVLSALKLGPGDALLTTNHVYPACLRALEHTCARTGSALQIAQIPFPGTTADLIVERVLAAVTPATRVALLDHVTSPTGLVFPIERLVKALAERGVETLVDGAHGPGMCPISLRNLGAAYYTANLHKWCCAPKGAGFLYVRPDRRPVHPLNISHAYTPAGNLHAEFDWTGTHDPTAWLTAPAAINFLGDRWGLDTLRTRCRTLALRGREILLDALEQPAPCSDDLIGFMATVTLPHHPGPWIDGMDPTHHALWTRHRIEVPIGWWPEAPRRFLRISAFLYNTEHHYERLARALIEVGR
jgi:isopenicillin-N epimerase